MFFVNAARQAERPAFWHRIVRGDMALSFTLTASRRNTCFFFSAVFGVWLEFPALNFLNRETRGMSLAFLSPALQSHALRESRPGAQAAQAPELSTGVRTLASVGALFTFAGAKAPRLAAQPARVSALDQESLKSNNKFAFKMVKICVIVTLLPFLFCIKNFFYDRSLSDFDVEYGPHLAHPALRTTSILQAVMVFAAVMWREKYRSDPIDRLFAWLFVPEAIAHILLHWFSQLPSGF